MLAKTTITRKLLAVFFLLVLAFGLTPKITLHNLVATHRDGRATKIFCPDPGSENLSLASFNCQCDTPIIESPFETTVEPTVAVVETVFNAYRNVYVESVYSSQQYCSALRGPPGC